MKKLLVIIFIVSIILSTTAYANDDVQYEAYAEKLNQIGVFKGTSSGYELDREPTRIEASVMFVRLLGAEQEALEKKYKHPFTDVPDWANAYVGYLYHEGLTNGVGETTFGSNDFIQAKSYFTFILRSLSYDDAQGDFSWKSAIEFTKEKSLITQSDYIELITNTFLRDHVAKYSYKALTMGLKDTEIILLDKLVALKIIDINIAEEISASEAELPNSKVVHDEIIELCNRKGWDKALIPMITSSIEFIINNTLLSSQEVISRLDKNVGQIIIPEEASDFGGAYIMDTDVILLNKYVYSEKILIHEIIHALSYHKDEWKLGFKYENNDYMNMTEGYTDVLATKSIDFKPRGTPVLYENMNTNQPILVYKTLSQAYIEYSSVFAALMYLTGENTFEEMFWADAFKYEELINKFDERYGKGAWEYLCKYTVSIPHICGGDPTEDKTEYILEYYDKILECLVMDLNGCENNEELINFSKKIDEISLAIPLYFNDYKMKLNDIRLELNEKLVAVSLDEYVNDYYAYRSPDFYNCAEGNVENFIRAMYNPHIMYTYDTFDDQVDKGNVVKIEYKEIPSGVGFKELKPGDIIPEGCEIAMTISNGIDVGEEYVVVPQIWGDEYGTKLDNIDDIENTSVFRKLRNIGLIPEIEWVEVPQMLPGSILGQDLEEGMIVKKGSKIVIKVSRK